MPRFGDFHDDSIYYVTAKSLAGGGGYRIESLPGEPAQTKYPPLYPLLLSIAWKFDPQFPRNLTIAAWISWLAFPAVLFQLPALFRRLEFKSLLAKLPPDMRPAGAVVAGDGAVPTLFDDGGTVSGVGTVPAQGGSLLVPQRGDGFGAGD